MLIAVSILSPVRTQIFIPALERVSIQEGTPSWSLSSMAVDPISVSSISITSATCTDLACHEEGKESCTWKKICDCIRHMVTKTTTMQKFIHTIQTWSICMCFVKVLGFNGYSSLLSPVEFSHDFLLLVQYKFLINIFMGVIFSTYRW